MEESMNKGIGLELQKAKEAWAKSSDRYLADLCNRPRNMQLRLESIEAWGRFNSLRLAYEKENRRKI